jgi:hypothetical protein
MLSKEEKKERKRKKREKEFRAQISWWIRQFQLLCLTAASAEAIFYWNDIE